MSLVTTPFLGPLTTVWTPPAACLETITYSPSAVLSSGSTLATETAALYFGATGNAVDLVCYPPRFKTDHVYSPGICPSGWQNSCELYIADKTTVDQCCPPDFTCNGFSECAQSATPTARAVWLLSRDGFGLEGTLTTTGFPTMDVYVKPILVAHQPSDQPMLASATQSSSMSQQPTNVQSTGGLAAMGSKHELSEGAIAGIAIAALFVGIILATLAAYVILRMCLGYGKLPRKAPSGGGHTQYQDQPFRKQTPISELSTIGQSMSSRAELRA